MKQRSNLLWIVLCSASSLLFAQCGSTDANATHSLQDTLTNPGKSDTGKVVANTPATPPAPFDTAAYNQKLIQITNGDSSGRWPVKSPYPLAGAILPFKRVIAYYGNLYSKQMGVLGEYPEDEMIKKLNEEVKKWETADPSTPVQPALHYIAVTAQGSPGAGGKYRLRMPFTQIDKVLAMAERANAILFLDVQVGLSNLETEIPELEKYLKMPNVHLGIDPEFAMTPSGKAPGKVVGTYDAADVNWTINYLAKLVKENNLPPKILVVHRFTGPMVTNADKIKPQPEVQVVMHMDGWGESERKIGTYKRYIYPYPVQFTGFKLFYKNDTKKVNREQIMQPEQLLKLKPQPVYIQYQ